MKTLKLFKPIGPVKPQSLKTLKPSKNPKPETGSGMQVLQGCKEGALEGTLNLIPLFNACLYLM